MGSATAEITGSNSKGRANVRGAIRERKVVVRKRKKWKGKEWIGGRVKWIIRRQACQLYKAKWTGQRRKK